MAGESDSLVEKLKEQRDRFIAFAFAGADLLLEMRDDDTVAYCAGAGEALYGLSDRDLMGKSLVDFVYPRDRTQFEEALQRLRNTSRLDHTPLSLMCSAGTVTRMRMAGIRLPHMDCYHLVLSRIPPASAGEGDTRSGTPDSKSKFVDMVRNRLNDANRAGHEVMLTLVELVGRGFEKLPPAEAQSLLGTLHHALESLSVDGASAGPITGRVYGVIHHQDTPPQAVRDKVSQLAQQFGSTLAGQSMQLRTHSLEMEDSTLSEDDIVRALTFIVNTYVRDSNSFAIRSLAEGAMAAIEDTITRVRNFRKMVKADSLSFIFQPAVNLRTGAVLHYEAFARLTHNNVAFTPAQILPFAADVGIINEFDISVCRKMFSLMRNPDEISPLAHVAVNISSQSIMSPIFYRALISLLQDNKPLLNRFVIELTDTTGLGNLEEARRLVARIRGLGVRISLDDFGPGGGAFDVLRTVPVDFAKIDPVRIRDAGDPKGLALLKAVASLCRDVGVIAIGESVEDSSVLQMLSEVGVDYAQGYYFGKPAPDTAKRHRYYTEHVERAGTAGASNSVLG